MCKSSFTESQMEVINAGLESGINVEDFAKPEINHEIMEEILKAKISGIDIMPYVEMGFNAYQLYVIEIVLA